MPSTLAELRRNPNWKLEIDESPWRSRKVHLGKSGFWSDSGDGTGTFCSLLPVYGRDYEVYDTLAWEPQQPRPWWRQTGIAVALGEDDIRDAAWKQDDSMIRLVETPATWLLSEPPCACILDWRCDLRQLLGGVHRIECSTERLKAALERQLDRQVKHRFAITAARKR